MRVSPATYGLTFSEVRFRSASSEETYLHGWIVPAQNPKAVLLLCHGIDSAAHAMLSKAALFARNGYTCMLFDFRGTGRSQGKCVTLGHHEAEDVQGAIAAIDSIPELRDLPVMALGESMGGSAVIRAAVSCDRICAIVSESTYATLADALGQRLKLLGPFASRVAAHCHRIGAEKYDLDIADVSPERDIAAFAPRPILIIHDNFDIMCTRSESDRLYAAAGHPKERWDVPYAPHTFAFMVAPREYERRVVEFLDRAVDQQSRMIDKDAAHSAA